MDRQRGRETCLYIVDQQALLTRTSTDRQRAMALINKHTHTHTHTHTQIDSQRDRQIAQARINTHRQTCSAQNSQTNTSNQGHTHTWADRQTDNTGPHKHTHTQIQREGGRESTLQCTQHSLQRFFCAPATSLSWASVFMDSCTHRPPHTRTGEGSLCSLSAV